MPAKHKASSPEASTANLGTAAGIGKEPADTFRYVDHPNLCADYVLANPPVSDSDWFRKDD